jgi:hypothetical protein
LSFGKEYAAAVEAKQVGEKIYMTIQKNTSNEQHELEAPFWVTRIWQDSQIGLGPGLVLGSVLGIKFQEC